MTRTNTRRTNSNSKSETNDDALSSFGATPTDSELNRKVEELSEEVIRQRGVIATLTQRLSFVMSMLGIDEELPREDSAAAMGSVTENSSATVSSDTVDDVIVTATQQQKLKPPDAFHNAVMSAVYAEQHIRQSRERNFVVSGLPISAECDDKTTIEHLCSKELNIKPNIRLCLRLGKQIQGKVQPVLVSLQSTDEASSVIANAKNLRNSSDPFVKAKVFINADLTKAQSAAAYKIRCQRRMRASARQSSQPGDRQSPLEHAMGNTLEHRSLKVEANPFVPNGGVSRDP